MDIFSLLRSCSRAESFDKEKHFHPGLQAIDAKVKRFALDNLEMFQKEGALFPSASAPQIVMVLLGALEEAGKEGMRQFLKRHLSKPFLPLRKVRVPHFASFTGEEMGEWSTMEELLLSHKWTRSSIELAALKKEARCFQRALALIRHLAQPHLIV